MFLFYLAIISSLSPSLLCAEKNELQSRVKIQFQIINYHLLHLSFPDRKLCKCYLQSSCDNPDPYPSCLFQFIFILPTEDGDIHQVATEFAELPPIPLARNSEKNGFWNQSYTMYLPSKPLSINILVVHQGHLISRSDDVINEDSDEYDADDGKTTHHYGITHATSFSYPLMNVEPTISPAQTKTYKLSEKGKNTRMTYIDLSVSIACLGNLIGPNCGMNCTRSLINPELAQCITMKTGYLSICRYMSSEQVDFCKPCPWGVRNGTYCEAEPGKILKMPQEKPAKKMKLSEVAESVDTKSGSVQPLTLVFMGLSVVLAGLLVFVVFYRGVKKDNISNPVFELLSVDEINE